MRYINNYCLNGDEVTIHIMSDGGEAFIDLNFYHKERHNMWVYNLNVEEYLRNKGYGNEIIQYAINIAKGSGCEYLYLSVKENSFMLDWYLRLGFKRFSNQDNFIQMFKKLK